MDTFPMESSSSAAEKMFVPESIQDVLENSVSETNMENDKLNELQKIFISSKFEKYKPAVVLDDIIDVKDIIRRFKDELKDLKIPNERCRYKLYYNMLMFIINDSIDLKLKDPDDVVLNDNVVKIYEYYIKVFMKFLFIYEDNATNMLNSLLNKHLKLSRYIRKTEYYASYINTFKKDLEKSKSETEHDLINVDVNMVETFLHSISTFLNTVTPITQLHLERKNEKVEKLRDGSSMTGEEYVATFYHKHPHIINVSRVIVNNNKGRTSELLQMEPEEAAVLRDKILSTVKNDNLKLYENIICCNLQKKEFLTLYNPNKKDFKTSENNISSDHDMLVLMNNIKVSIKINQLDSIASIKVFPHGKGLMMVVNNEDDED